MVSKTAFHSCVSETIQMKSIVCVHWSDYKFYTACRNFFKACDSGIILILGIPLFILLVFSLHGYEEKLY